MISLMPAPIHCYCFRKVICHKAKEALRRGLACFLLLIALVGTITTAHAQTKTKLPGEDWINLFDGTDLRGWTKIGSESWTVEGGLLHGKGLTKEYGYLGQTKTTKTSRCPFASSALGMGIAACSFTPVSSRIQWMRRQECSSRLIAT